MRMEIYIVPYAEEMESENLSVNIVERKWMVEDEPLDYFKSM